ncbi:MAG: type II secretion system F family protein [Actinobacteria bacterium]|nr:type II secretion system F family protein [Actinomycetota bacterium]
MSLFLVFTVLCVAGTSALYLWRAARRRENARAKLSPHPADDPASDGRDIRSLLPRLLGVWERAGGRGARLRRFLLPTSLVLPVLALTRNPLLAIAAWPASTFTRRFLHRQRRGKARARKEEQVLEFIDSLSQSLRSGLSLRQSLELSLEDIGEELGVDVLEVLKDIRMGGGLEESLTLAAHRSTSPSLRITFTVLGLLHGKGGDLPRILERLRKRVAGGLEVRREARMLTAQSRASGYLVSSLPVVFLLLQAALNPRSLHPLFATGMGNLIVVTAVALNAAAFFLIRRMVNPEV